MGTKDRTEAVSFQADAKGARGMTRNTVTVWPSEAEWKLNASRNRSYAIVSTSIVHGGQPRHLVFVIRISSALGIPCFEYVLAV